MIELLMIKILYKINKNIMKTPKLLKMEVTCYCNNKNNFLIFYNLKNL
jgi:hypothetical protein